MNIQRMSVVIGPSAMCFGAKDTAKNNNEVFGPVRYNPVLMAKNLKGAERRQTIAHFKEHNRLAPAARRAAEDLSKLLAEKKAPRVTLYPIPNPYALDVITLEVPLPKGRWMAARKEKANAERDRLMRLLKTVSAVFQTGDDYIFTYPHGWQSYRVALTIEPTEEEARWMETYT